MLDYGAGPQITTRCRPSLTTSPIDSAAADGDTCGAMQLANEAKNFFGACERLISLIASNRRLTEDEARMIEFYCKEVLAKIAPRLASPQ